MDVLPEEGAQGIYNAVLTGEELRIWIANQWEDLNNYLELMRLGGKITVFATTSSGTASTTLTMDDLRVYPVTAELGTNGVVRSNDGVISVMVPRAALWENYTNPPSGTNNSQVQRAGLMITPTAGCRIHLRSRG